MTNKDFWEKVKPALTDKNPNHQDDIILKESDDLIIDDNKISEILNQQYVNIVEISTGSAPTNLGDFDITNKESIIEYINKIISHFQEHPSIKIIKEQTQTLKLPIFKTPLAEIEDINKILNDLNIKKSPGPDLLPPELVKYVATIIN